MVNRIVLNETSLLNFVNIFEKNPERVHRKLGAWILKG